MTTYSVLPSGYDIDLLRNGGHFIMRDPAGLAAGVYFIEVSEARDDQGVRRTIQKFENASSGAVFTRAVATTGWSSFIEVSATTAITLSGSQTGGLAKFASDTSLQQATAEEVRTAAGGISEPLSANRTYYVSTTGSDSNDGLTAGTPFLTRAKAWATILTLDLKGFSVTVSMAAGTYTDPFTAQGRPAGLTDATSVTFSGAGASTIISTGATAAFDIGDGALFTVANMTIVGSAVGIRARAGGRINLGTGLVFAGGGYQMRCAPGSMITNTSGISYTISAGATSHVYVNGGQVVLSGCTVTLTGTPAFSQFINCDTGGTVSAFSQSYSGAATGSRYSVTLGGVISTFGGGASYFPGDSAGSTATGGQYG